MSATTALVLDTRRAKKTQKYPVKLRVTYNRDPQYYQTIFDLTEENWQKLSASRISDELQSVRNKLKEIEHSAATVAEKILPFNFQAFERSFVLGNPLFRQRKSKIVLANINAEDDFDYSPLHKRFPILQEENCKPCTLTWSYKQYIKRLIREDRIGSAVAYHCSFASLKRFKGNVLLSDITVSFLRAYEKSLKDNGLSKSTVGIYLRPLRAIFNDVISQGLLRKETAYPFGAKKYTIPTAKKVKKALDLNDVKRIYYYRCTNENSSEQMAKDFWLFSYFGNRVNPKDIALLQWKYMADDYITFERAKTEHSLRGDPVTITVYVNEDMKAIIQRWGNKDQSPNSYIFPILEKGLSAIRVYDRIQNFVYFINYWMREILCNLGIDKKATTYVARHTFSTVMKRSGASIEYIQESLGHADKSTTQDYLDSFPKEMKREFASKLASFKQISTPTEEFIN